MQIHFFNISKKAQNISNNYANIIKSHAKWAGFWYAVFIFSLCQGTQQKSIVSDSLQSSFSCNKYYNISTSEHSKRD